MIDSNEPQDELPEPIDPSSIMFPRLIPKPGGMGMRRMRDYQTECVDSIYEAWQDHQAVVAVLATGLGKTVIASEVIGRWPGTGRILFIAHVRELIDQACESIEYHLDEPCSIEMGINSESKRGALPIYRTLIASVQSMHRRLHRFNPLDFDLVIIDEFHHAAANTYRAVWEWLKTGNPAALLLGITATPDRADKKALACVADHCAYEMNIRDGIDAGWLVPIKQQYIVVDGLDFSKCRNVGKDLNEGDLESAMMGDEVDDGMTPEQRQEALEKQERMLHAVAAPAVKEAQGRNGIVYCVTVNHATRMAEVLRRYPGITAKVISGTTPDTERKDLVKQFKTGQLQFLVNVGVCTEGFDVPGAHLIVMARPTKSRALYTQMVGRGTRPVAGLVDRLDTPELRIEAIGTSLKPNMLVLDFVGVSGKHKLISTADVLAGDMPEPFVKAAIQEMRDTGEAKDIREAAWAKKEQHDEEAARRQEEERKRKEDQQRVLQAKEEARRARLRAEAEYRTREVNPFDRTDVAAERSQPEFRGGATDKQIGLLKQLGIPAETSMKWRKGQAGAVITDLKNRSGGRFIMRFGKHQGKSIKSLPVDYLKWAGQNMQNQEFQQNLEQYRGEWLLEREQTEERRAIQDESGFSNPDPKGDGDINDNG